MRVSRIPGFTLLEVLVAIVVLALGLLGLGGLQAKLQTVQAESYQRSQAVLVLEDITSRMRVNPPEADDYVTGAASPLGTGDSQPADCSTLTSPEIHERDACEWSNLLKGASVTKGSNRIGAMIDARGCIERVQTPNNAAGICQPGIYRISVVWQGLSETSEPSAALACGEDLYGDERLRRVITTTLTIGLPRCS